MPAKTALEPYRIDAATRKRRGKKERGKPSDLWRVDVPASMSDTHKRVRPTFQTRESARDYIDRIEGKDAPDKAIDPRLAQDANTARERLAKAALDLTLAEAVRELVEAREILGDSGSLKEAAEAFAKSAAERVASMPFGEAVVAFLTVKEESLREKTLGSYRYTLERTLAPLHSRILSDLRPDDLAAILGEKKPTARAMHLRNLRAFWRWACREPREWARVGVVDSLEYRREAPEGDTVVLKPAEARALLRAAEKESPAAAAAYAVALFAGVRMAELARLNWGDIQGEHVEIGAHVAKKTLRRLVPICPALKAWLAAYRPRNVDRAEKLVGLNWVEVSKAVRRRAGWEVEARTLKRPPKPTRGPWPQNACRHTCASVLVANGEPLETLTFQFGHAGGHDLLRRHYVGRLTKRQAIEIQSIGPKGKKIETTRAA